MKNLLSKIFFISLTGCLLVHINILPQIRSDVEMVEPLFFESPEIAVSIISELLAEKGWPTLSRYYDLAETEVKYEYLNFFVRNNSKLFPFFILQKLALVLPALCSGVWTQKGQTGRFG